MKDYLLIVVHLLQRLLECSAIKGLISCIGSILSSVMLGPSGDGIGMQMVAVLVFLDILTGIFKAIKLKTFTSTDLRKLTAGKILTYFVVLFTANTVAVFMPFMKWLAHAVQIWVGITEFSSIAENMSELTGMKIPTINTFKEIYDKYFANSKTSSTAADKTPTTTDKSDTTRITTTITVSEDKDSDTSD